MAAGHAVRGTALLRNWFLSMAGHVLPLLIGLACVPAILRELGAERFGVLVLTWTLLGMFSVFDLGLGWAVTRFIAKALGSGDRSAIAGIIWPAVAAQAALGGLGGALLAVGATYLASSVLNVPAALRAEAISTFRIVGLSLPVVLVSVSFRGALEAAQRFGTVTAIRAASSASTFVVPIAGILLGMDLPRIVLAQLGIRTLILAWLVSSCIRALPIVGFPVIFKRDDLYKLVTFGGWVTLSGLTSLALSHADRVIIGHVLTLAAVSHYSIPQEVVMRLGVLSVSVATVLFPAFATLVGAKDLDGIRRLFVRAGMYLCLTACPVFGLMAILAPDIMRAWLGPAVAAESSPVLRIMAIGAGLQVLAVAPYTMLQGVGRPDLTARLHLIETPFYLVALWTLTRSVGVAGAALAWSGRVVFDVVVLFWMAGRAVGGMARAPWDVLRAFGSVLGVSGLWTLIYALNVSVGIKIGLLGGVMGFFGWWVWRMVLSTAERESMSRLASQVRQTLGLWR